MKLTTCLIIVLIATNCFAAKVEIEQPETIELKPGQTYAIPGTSYEDTARVERKKKIAPYFIAGYLLIFFL